VKKIVEEIQAKIRGDENEDYRKMERKLMCVWTR